MQLEHHHYTASSKTIMCAIAGRRLSLQNGASTVQGTSMNTAQIVTSGDASDNTQLFQQNSGTVDQGGSNSGTLKQSNTAGITQQATKGGSNTANIAQENAGVIHQQTGSGSGSNTGTVLQSNSAGINQVARGGGSANGIAMGQANLGFLDQQINGAAQAATQQPTLRPTLCSAVSLLPTAV